MDHKQTYEAPRIIRLGSIADLTQMGPSNEGGDFKCGSGGANPLGIQCGDNTTPGNSNNGL